MPNLISSQAPAATLDTVKAAVNTQVTTLTPFKVGLNEDEKKGARTMSVGREGLARMIGQIATANINSLAREHNPADLASRLAYDSKLEEVRQVTMTLLELITETQLANSVDIMTLVDAYFINLQASRRNNSTLDAAMREVDEWNKRFVSKNAEKPETPTV
jgi:hypothetical protein